MSWSGIYIRLKCLRLLRSAGRKRALRHVPASNRVAIERVQRVVLGKPEGRDGPGTFKESAHRCRPNATHVVITDCPDKGAEADRFSTKSHTQGTLMNDVRFNSFRENHRRPPRLIEATPRRASMLPRGWDRRSAAVAVLRIDHQFSQGQVAHFAQSRQINLRIDLSSNQRNVAEMVGNLLERNSFRQKMGSAGMSKRMRSIGH